MTGSSSDLAGSRRPGAQNPKAQNDTLSDALSRSLCRKVSSQWNVKDRQKDIFIRRSRDDILVQRRGYVPSA